MTKRPKAEAPKITEAMRHVLADPFVLGALEPPTWSPPLRPVPNEDLQSWIRTIEYLLQPTSAEDLELIVGAFAKVLKHPSDTESTWTARAEMFAIGCNDVPPDLLQSAVETWIKTQTEFPEIPIFRKLFGDKIGERQTMLRRAREMLQRATNTRKVSTTAPAVFEKGPQTVRLAELIEMHRRRGNDDRAAPHERLLAKLEGREPEEWARREATPAQAAEVFTPRPVPVATTAERLGIIARKAIEKSDYDWPADPLPDMPDMGEEPPPPDMELEGDDGADQVDPIPWCAACGGNCFRLYEHFGEGEPPETMTRPSARGIEW